MAPIRIALIGLSQAAKTSWAAEGHLPYLLSERGQAKFKIVALLNSSAEAAQKAKEDYNLLSDVKTYSSPGDLAADAEIDLVVCTTRVDVHYDTIKPSIEAGRNVFVEWPLAENVNRASELAREAKGSGSKTLVGLQGRLAPPVLKVKELIRLGTIGKVVSSDVVAFTPGAGGSSISAGLGDFMDRKIGGNPITIAFAHVIDYVHCVLGEWLSLNVHTQTERPHQDIVDSITGERRSVVSDVPDLLSAHGTLKTSEWVTEGATLVVNFHSGPPFPGAKPFVWTITGERGRVRISNERGPSLSSEASAWPTPIEVEDYASGEVREVDWKWEDWQKPLLARGRNIGKLYDLYSEGLVLGMPQSDTKDDKVPAMGVSVAFVQ